MALSKLGRLFGSRKRSAFNALQRSADESRDKGDFANAASLYAQLLSRRPDRHDLRVQRAHMLKEAGAMDAAEREYLTASEGLHEDADLALQLGHLYASMARDADAEQWYQRASVLDPMQSDAVAGLARLQARQAIDLPIGITDTEIHKLTPSIDPKYALPPEIISRDHHVEIKQLGHFEQGRWGRRKTLYGVEAIRGYRLSSCELEYIEVVIGSQLLHRERLRQGRHSAFKKYVFNLWLDVSDVTLGLHKLELRFTTPTGSFYHWVEDVVVRPLSESDDDPESDSLCYLPPEDMLGVEARVRALPSVVRAPALPPFSGGIRNVLLLRTDQLGDLVASLPAILRLKEIAPDAKLVAILTGANADLAQTLDLFDEIIVIDFPDDPATRRRLMSLSDQAELARRLTSYNFDVAIDLASSYVSRPLLQLSGARYKFGFNKGDDIPLDGVANILSPDARTGMDRRPHSTKVLALVEAFGGLQAGPSPIRRRSDLTRDQLVKYGLEENLPFAVLHTGARIGFSHWPYYEELAERLVSETSLTVVIIAPDQKGFGDNGADYLKAERLIRLNRKIPFDDLDAFLSFASIMVGNDSGPKHLAALRGTQVVTLFSARIGWAEWGQEQTGAIISRRVPCAGCAIYHDDDECGKDFACIRDIRVDEAFQVIKNILEKRAEP